MKLMLVFVARTLFGMGVVLILLSAMAFAGTALYEWVVPPGDMHLAGLVTAMIILYVAPLGTFLLVLSGLVWVLERCMYHRQRASQESIDALQDDAAGNGS